MKFQCIMLNYFKLDTLLCLIVVARGRAVHGYSNHSNLEMEAECLTKNLSYLNLNISKKQAVKSTRIKKSYRTY